jgi:hypothetical protein
MPYPLTVEPEADDLFEPIVGHGTEVYSKVRKSSLEPSQYMDRYYDDPKSEKED